MGKGMGNSLCCGGKFPIFGVLLFAVAVLWLLNDLKILAINVPWLPIAVLVFSVKMMAHHCWCKK